MKIYRVNGNKSLSQLDWIKIMLVFFIKNEQRNTTRISIFCNSFQQVANNIDTISFSVEWLYISFISMISSIPNNFG